LDHNSAVKSIDPIEKSMMNIQYEDYDVWIKNFSLNLSNIWNETSSRDLSKYSSKQNNTAIVIGKGPSIDEHKHLQLLSTSNFSGSIVCCDGKLIDTLKAGVTPEKFPNFYVVSIDPGSHITKWFEHPLISEFGSKIKGIFTTIASPITVEQARKSGIKIHWMHSLFDYDAGKKSFNYISSIMVRSKNHVNGLPAIQTGGNAGTSSWFVSWKILQCTKVVLIGMNHGWNEDTPMDIITKHGVSFARSYDESSPSFKRLFPKIYNPELKKYCILDPIFQYYREAMLEFISRSPSWLQTINATEGGSLFGNKLLSMKFSDFLAEYS
jgi:hypothetical protein